MTDREKLIDLLCHIPGAEEIADFFLANGVTIPVRCKDCKHAGINENHPKKPLICYLTRMCGSVDPEWYCWQEERKYNENQG